MINKNISFKEKQAALTNVYFYKSTGSINSRVIGRFPGYYFFGTGAAAQFILSRNWVFNADRQKSTTWVQLIKFVVMWVGNIALSAFGIYLLTHYIHLHYLLSKLIVSPLLGVSYNYLVCKKFVFV